MLELDYTNHRYIIAIQKKIDWDLIYDLDGKQTTHPCKFSSIEEVEEFINRFKKLGDWDYYTLSCQDGNSSYYQGGRLPPCVKTPRDKHCSYWCVSHQQCQWTD